MGKQDLSRRELFTLWRRGLKGFDAEVPSAPPPPRHILPEGLAIPLRPPGAISEQALADTCTRCNQCVAVCPVQAIVPLPDTYGPWAGTPHIVPRQSPCVLCDGLLCIDACPSGALRPILPTEDLRIGTAKVNGDTCLPFLGTFCDACAQSCPEPLAIQFDNQGRPRVSGYHCTGCGQCEKICPTEVASITIFPVGK